MCFYTFEGKGPTLKGPKISKITNLSLVEALNHPRVMQLVTINTSTFVSVGTVICLPSSIVLGLFGFVQGSKGSLLAPITRIVSL